MREQDMKLQIKKVINTEVEVSGEKLWWKEPRESRAKIRGEGSRRGHGGVRGDNMDRGEKKY